ncbi:hypothetical protein ZIOFF_026285 [Zingiber officinale]|uniref:EIPR1-like beta-propeller domain-containing protein n=1 Tax=Zingiber officinale TaxID=94328 RepID=A0A8J5LEP1_ZINOF|nr:hypothetical protein ZIOFF_026285 [Zingiber officinale]
MVYGKDRATSLVAKDLMMATQNITDVDVELTILDNNSLTEKGVEVDLICRSEPLNVQFPPRRASHRPHRCGTAPAEPIEPRPAPSPAIGNHLPYSCHNAGDLHRNRLWRPQVPGRNGGSHSNSFLLWNSTNSSSSPLPLQARCIADVKADVDHTSFLAGTLSLKEENEVHLIRLSPSGSELICDGLFYHPNEIWDLKTCPFDPRIFSTVFTSGEAYGASVWKIPELYGQSNAPQLEQLVSLDKHSFKIKCVLWWPSGKHDRLISIDEGNLFLWSIDSSNKVAKVVSQESVGMLQNLSGGAWDPHDRNALAGICDSSFQFWDLRTMKYTIFSIHYVYASYEVVLYAILSVHSSKFIPQDFCAACFLQSLDLDCLNDVTVLSRKTTSIEQAHTRDIDYNSKKQHLLVTAEDVSGIRLWDLRRPKFPVKELPGHAHWTWASAGTDSTVNLWLADLPATEDLSNESLFVSSAQLKNSLINSYTDYEDSVYGLAWSTREPLIFASLSYDGRLSIPGMLTPSVSTRNKGEKL